MHSLSTGSATFCTRAVSNLVPMVLVIPRMTSSSCSLVKWVFIQRSVIEYMDSQRASKSSWLAFISVRSWCSFITMTVKREAAYWSSSRE